MKGQSDCDTEQNYNHNWNASDKVLCFNSWNWTKAMDP